jgi:hypothetical protein
MVSEWTVQKYITLEKHVFCSLAQATSPEVEVAVLQRLRNLIDQQRDQIRTRDRELSAKSVEVDNVSKICCLIM